MSDSILVVRDDAAVRTLTLNRPAQKNALNAQLISALRMALDDASKDEAVKVVVIASEGSAFCAGADLKGFTAVRGGPEDFAGLLVGLWRMNKPVIARVQGAALGGGFGIAAASTFTLATEDAQFGTPEIEHGLFPMMIMAALARSMPRRRLLQMMLLGEKIGAAEALSLGLINQVVPREDLDAAVSELAARLSQKSAQAISRGMNAWNHVEALPFEEAVPFLRDELYALLDTDEVKAKVAAFRK